jgi:tight adherence protein B
VSAALLCLCTAVLTWPQVSAVDRLRVRTAGPRAALPVAAAVPVAAGALAAVLSTPVVAVLSVVVAGVGVRGWSSRRRARDALAQVGALAESLGVLAAELRAGRPMSDATTTAVAGCPHPATAGALRPALTGGAVADGLPPEARAALARVVTAAAVSARTGCSLAAVVTAAEDDLRAGLRTRAELGAALSGPRASAAVLAGLPVLGLLMGAGIGADPWRVLTTTPAGAVLLLVGVGLEVAGLVWSGRLAERAARS